MTETTAPTNKYADFEAEVREYMKYNESRHETLTDILKGMQDKDKETTDTLKRIEGFMLNLNGLNNFVTGVDLLKKPTLWLLAFVIGFVALVGGLKTLFGWFFVMK